MSMKACVICDTLLKEPYILCAECTDPQVYLCLKCFAKGEELYPHENNHKYSIIKNNFPILDSSWTAQEEVLLLDAICDNGFGNWDDVSNQVPTKSKQECESHYINCYVENATSPLIEFPERNYTKMVFPSAITHKVSDDPPRPALDSQLYTEMAGYMAARADFNTEYDNYAEHDVCQMEFNDDEDSVDSNLKIAVLGIYNRRLRERARRKKIIARYGLINVQKAALSMRRYNGVLGRHVSDGLLGFMQLVEPISFDLFTESLYYEAELKHRIKALQEFRQVGLTRFYSTKLYSFLRQRRNERKNKPKHLDNVLDHIQNEMTCQQWLHRHVLAESKGGGIVPVLPTLQRKSAPPLNIVGMPGYDKLNDSEKELCAHVRLVPDSFLEFKSILIGEYEKQGSLRLSQARTLIKIDVNKTRKLFDFLVKDGLISSETKTNST